MSKYKKIMLQKGIMQKELLDGIRRADMRVDSPLLSKIVNDICLPTKPTLETICKTLSCGVLDLYDEREIALNPTVTQSSGNATPKTGGGDILPDTLKTRARRAKNDFYNLTVEIPRELAERVFNKAALRKLGFLSKSDFVRQAVLKADERLTRLNQNKTATNGKNKPQTAEIRQEKGLSHSKYDNPED